MRKILFVMAAVLLTAAAADAKIPDMKFRRLDTRDGLSNSQVNCVFRDGRGYLWMGTAYGLNRYDGYRVKNYYSNRLDTTSMRDNYTSQIQEDFKGKLWLKQGMGYCVYDPQTDSFERDAGREVRHYLGNHNAVEQVYIDGNKNFWVKYYEEGFYYYNPKTRWTKLIKQGYEPGQYKPNYGVSTIADYGDKVIVATTNGELVCLNGKEGKVEWENTWMRDNGGLPNQEYKLHIDKEGNYWVVTQGYTFIYIRKENRWYKQVTELLRAVGIADCPESLQVWDVKTDKNGRLWIATDHAGLVVVDMKDRQLRQFMNSKNDESTISDNTTKHINIDKNGHVWISTYKNGVNQYLDRQTSMRSIEVGDINAVAEDKYGNWWLGSNENGLTVYNPKTSEVLANYTTANTQMLSNIVVGSCKAADGSVWFGSYNGGMNHAVPRGSDGQADIYNYRVTGEADGLATNNVWSVTEDKRHRIWIATLGGGIQMLDPKTGKFRTWNTKNTNIPSDYMTSASWIRKGWLMVGTSWYYCFLNPVTGKLANRVIPESPNVTVVTSSTVCVMEDSRGLIWQGSSSGACIFDQQTGNVWLLDMSDGLFGSSVCSIVEDKSHMMWVVTDHGVSKVIPEKDKDGSWQFTVSSYNVRDGLQNGTYNQRSAFVTSDGLLLVGGQGGLDIINPSALSDVKSKERPLFSGLQIFDVDVPVGKKFNGRVILDEALDVSGQITLRFNDQFTLQLASDAGVIKNGKRFVYRLDGFNDNWVKTSELNPNITYNSLRAGSYTLHVRMLNDDGTFSEEEAELGITILPPLWRTRWAMLLYVLLVLVAAWLWRRWFIRRQSKRMEVETVRRELEKQQWMNEMRLQLAKEHEKPDDTPAAAESPAMVANRQRTEFVGFLRRLCESYVSPVADKRVKVNFLTTAATIDVDVDRKLMAEVLHILFRNSATFSPHDCLISVGVATMAGNKAQIQVADNGIGIKDEYKTHAFDPLVNGEGIGLDYVKSVVDVHGGDIRIEDNPGGGTIFVITLPVVDTVEDAVLMDD